MINQKVSYNNTLVTLVSTSDDVLTNAARYQARLIQSRGPSAAVSAPIMENIKRFSLILAHVSDTSGFPFAIPDPLAHSETVGLAWDAYMADDTQLWDQLLAAIDIAPDAAKTIENKLWTATQELGELSAHHHSPFKRKPDEKRKSR